MRRELKYARLICLLISTRLIQGLIITTREIIESRGFYYYEGREEAARIRQHYGDTATFDYEEIGGGVDLCLIDAAHSYEYVRNDTAKIAAVDGNR